jgi:hypothetical protein
MLGVTGALGVGAIAAGSYAVTSHDSLKSSCGMTLMGCTDDQINGLRATTIATDVLIGLTAASAIVTVALFIVEPRLGQRRSDRARLRVTPSGVTF